MKYIGPAIAVAGLILAGIFAPHWGLARGAAVFFVVLVVGLVFWAVVHGTQGRGLVVFYEDGLSCTTPRGHATMAWAHVKHFFVDAETFFLGYGPTISPAGKMTLVAHDGRELTIPCKVEPYAELWARLNNLVSRPLLPGVRASLADGDTLTFGPIAISRDGAGVGGRFHAWDDIEEARVSPAQFVLVRKGAPIPWVTTALREVPHPYVLVEAVKAFKKVVTI